jgi:hypothetical protein
MSQILIFKVISYIIIKIKTFLDNLYLKEINFCFVLRRYSKFYMINLVLPFESMSILALLVFALTTKSEEKVQLSINILFALTFFYLLFFEILPPTSLVFPIIVKNLVLTMTFNVICTFLIIYVINIHYRRPEFNYNMPNIVRKIFLEILPKYIFIAEIKNDDLNQTSNFDEESFEMKKFNNLKKLETYHYRGKSMMKRIYAYSCRINELDKSNIKLTSSMSFNSKNALISKNYDNVFLYKPNKNKSRKNLNFQNLLLQNLESINEMSCYFKKYNESKKVVYFII